MTTIINTPGNGSNDSSPLSMLIGGIVLLILGVLFYIYILPFLLEARQAPATTTTEIKVEIPVPEASNPPS
jgi:hypothetical protein